ncbi:MAG: hypothetical protein ACU85E_18185 [Gammaproteobacteria bacterium]
MDDDQKYCGCSFDKTLSPELYKLLMDGFFEKRFDSKSIPRTINLILAYGHYLFVHKYDSDLRENKFDPILYSNTKSAGDFIRIFTYELKEAASKDLPTDILKLSDNSIERFASVVYPGKEIRRGSFVDEHWNPIKRESRSKSKHKTKK